MFLRLLTESFRRQKRRKALAGLAILLGTTAVTAMLALATSIGDRIHQELAVYGANIVVTPKAANLDVNLGGQNLKPATADAYLHESDLPKLQTIFWANNITAISPEFHLQGQMAHVPYLQEKAAWYADAKMEGHQIPDSVSIESVGLWFNHSFGALTTGAPSLHPWWKLVGRWPSEQGGALHGNGFDEEVVVGAKVAKRFNLVLGDTIILGTEHSGRVVGIVSSGDKTDEQILYSLEAALPVMRPMVGAKDPAPISLQLSRIEIAARTRPEDAFARKDPDTLSAKQKDLWYCRPYANSIAYQIQQAIPGSTAQQVRKVEQTEGTVLSRISGLLWLISAAALLAAGFAVSAAMATAVLERRAEIGLMRSLGAAKASIAALFYAESTLLALAAATLGYLLGSVLAYTLGNRIFPNDTPAALFDPALFPIVTLLAILVAIAGSIPSIRAALNANVTNALHNNV